MFDALDVLYIVIAFCLIWFTAFVCWLIWQVAMILKNVNDTLQMAQEKLAMIEQAITAIRKKFDKATMGLGTIVDGAKKVVEFATDIKGKKLRRQEEPEQE